MSSQQTLSERVYNAVLDKIVRREFPEAGRRPSEAALAEVFGVSRLIVREALARLRDDGITLRQARVVRQTGRLLRKKPVVIAQVTDKPAETREAMICTTSLSTLARFSAG